MPEVLIVDDSPDIRSMLIFALGDQGLVCGEAADGFRALEVLEHRPPDVLVLDLMMPDLDGFGVLQAMRERGIATATRVIILTCKMDERDMIRGWELGADEYLTKPINPDHLAAKIHHLAGVGAGGSAELKLR
jgi:two-component system OmpR family response regulator